MNIVAFVISFIVFVGGLLLMGFSFSTPGVELVMFLGGILAVGVAVAIPAHLLKRIDR
ncbi:hypothetical protein FB562_0746 [Homoserinimonas aerilata]|uniref:Uncharacterized protein n=1 Tax=Homoserinimonas aerilata TaxID=1162970 RepID=A0A542YHU8_9MICO|nr:hypothetical protein [Homoserinimonas aerilata]TQL47680.1 hypothetical protein FB562_0746 [Homoserinimonas aerilata]